ncbi:hypothetical protein M9458_001797, partial [Cirrhinus mrigala]
PATMPATREKGVDCERGEKCSAHCTMAEELLDSEGKVMETYADLPHSSHLRLSSVVVIEAIYELIAHKCPPIPTHPLSPPPVSESWTLPWPVNPAAPPWLLAPSSLPWPISPLAPS